MAKLISIKQEMSETGSGYPDPRFETVAVFDSEPTREQQKQCEEQHMGMEWANGKTFLPPGMEQMNWEQINKRSDWLSNIFWISIVLFALAVIFSCVGSVWCVMLANTACSGLLVGSGTLPAVVSDKQVGLPAVSR